MYNEWEKLLNTSLPLVIRLGRLLRRPLRRTLGSGLRRLLGTVCRAERLALAHLDTSPTEDRLAPLPGLTTLVVVDQSTVDTPQRDRTGGIHRHVRVVGNSADNDVTREVELLHADAGVESLDDDALEDLLVLVAADLESSEVGGLGPGHKPLHGVQCGFHE